VGLFLEYKSVLQNEQFQTHNESEQDVLLHPAIGCHTELPVDVYPHEHQSTLARWGVAPFIDSCCNRQT